MHHKKGKIHIKAVNEMSKKPQENSLIEAKQELKSEFTESDIKKLRTVAHLETWIMRMKDLLNDVFIATENLIRKKQSKHYNEIEADYEMN